MTPHAWAPVSPCGPDCAQDPEPVVPVPRRVLRAFLALSLIFCAVVAAPAAAIVGMRARKSLFRALCRGMLRVFGVQLNFSGDTGFLDTSVPRGSLVVSNHVSWLDILAVNAVRPMRALGKAQIRQWPIVGPIAARVGTLFVERDSLRTLPETISTLTEALRAEGTVYVTPEGTTWCGMRSGPFKPAVFQAAIHGGVPVRPIALNYQLSDRTTTWPAFIGDETLIDSVRRVLRLRGLVLELRVHTEIAPGSTTDRRELAAIAEKAVHSPRTVGMHEEKVHHTRNRPAPRTSAPEHAPCTGATPEIQPGAPSDS